MISNYCEYCEDFISKSPSLNLGQFAPLRCQLLTGAAPGREEVHQPHLVLRLGANLGLEVVRVKADDSRAEDVQHEVSHLLRVVIALQGVKYVFNININYFMLKSLNQLGICVAWSC